MYLGDRYTENEANMNIDKELQSTFQLALSEYSGSRNLT